MTDYLITIGGYESGLSKEAIKYMLALEFSEADTITVEVVHNE